MEALSAREVYEQHVKRLPPEERKRLAEIITDAIEQSTHQGERSLLELEGLGAELLEQASASDFERQKAAFKAIPPLIRERYRGQFIASYNGAIVDCDVDLPSLTNRFFSKYGDVPVYITRIGGRQRVLLRTPHLR